MTVAVAVRNLQPGATLAGTGEKVRNIYRDTKTRSGYFTLELQKGTRVRVAEWNASTQVAVITEQ